MSAPAPSDLRVLPDAALLGKGLAALRIFVGLIALLNGLAKVFGWHSINLGAFQANLINRDDARFILEFEVFRNPAGGTEGTRVPLIRDAADFVLDNWGFFEWALTVVEVGTGLLLVAGLATRAGALVALGMHLTLALVYATSDRWLFEQPHEYIPLIILTLIPSGRVWGLDARVLAQRGRSGAERSRPDLLRNWPF